MIENPAGKMKELKFIIHCGYGKTATTWLQTEVFPNIADTIYLGANQLGVMRDRELNHAHYSLFGPYPNGHRGNLSNSSELVKKYVAIIKQRILSDWESKVRGDTGLVIISNETILAFDNSAAELNIYLMKQILYALNVELSDQFRLSSKIVVVFREQTSLIQSFYAYNYHKIKQKTLSGFVEEQIKSPHEGFFGGLWYDQIIDSFRGIFDDINLTFLPYEWLQTDKKRFLTVFFADSISVTDSAMQKFLQAPERNRNNRGDANILRDISVFNKLINLLVERGHNYKTSLSRIIPGSLKNLILNYLASTKTHSVGLVVMSQSDRKTVCELYSESNSRVERMLQVELETLGYSVSFDCKNSKG